MFHSMRSFTHNTLTHKTLPAPVSVPPRDRCVSTAGPGWLCVLPRGRMNVNVNVKSHNLAVPTLRRGKPGRVGW